MLALRAFGFAKDTKPGEAKVFAPFFLQPQSF